MSRGAQQRRSGLLPARRPWPIRAFNAVGFHARLDLEDLLARARKRAGIPGTDDADFGAPPLREPLGYLLESIETEAQLHRFGHFITRERLVNVLANRLRAEALFRGHPEILDEPLRPPIVIAGLQRTGTTLLHRLLSLHPQLTALRSWEALAPVPLPGDTLNRKRIAQSRMAERALRYMAPDFFAIHPVEHQAPEEDILLNDMSFLSTVPEATMHVPGYAAWVEAQDHRPAYAFLRRMLQLLQWQRRQVQGSAGDQAGGAGGTVPDAARTPAWVLKTPQNLEFLDVLMEQFPDAHIVHTYRDPRRVIASFSSMVYHSRRVFSNRVDPHACAAHWLRKDAYMVERSMAFWARLDGQGRLANTRFNCSYYDLTADPRAVLERLVGFCGLEHGPQYAAVLDRALKDNRRNKYGVHRYQLSDFGLEPEAVDAAFADYRAQFSIPIEADR